MADDSLKDIMAENPIIQLTQSNSFIIVKCSYKKSYCIHSVYLSRQDKLRYLRITQKNYKSVMLSDCIIR